MPTAILKRDRSLAGERFFLRPWRALWLGAALLLLFVLLALLVPAKPFAIEQHWADWMREIQTSLLQQIALVFNYLGRGLGRALVQLVPRRRFGLVRVASSGRPARPSILFAF